MATAERMIQEDEESIKTVNAKQSVRKQLDADIEAFLSKGGSINEIDVNVSADPPTKPVSKYGGRPIRGDKPRRLHKDRILETP